MRDQFTDIISPPIQLPGYGPATDISLAGRGTTLYLVYKGSDGNAVDISNTNVYLMTISLPSWNVWTTAQWSQGNYVLDSAFGPWLTASPDPQLTLVAQSSAGGFDLGCHTYDGNNVWSGGFPDFPGNTGHSGAAAYYNGKLIVAWRGLNPDQQVYLSVLEQIPAEGGQKHHHPPIFVWDGKVSVPKAFSSDGPALAVCNGLLYVCWKGEDGDTRIFYSTYDGANFSQPQVVTGAQTITAPMLCAEYPAGPLYCCWVGAVAPNVVYSIFRPGPDLPVFVWGPPLFLPGSHTNARPAMAFCGDDPYVGWVDPAGNITWGLLNALEAEPI